MKLTYLQKVHLLVLGGLLFTSVFSFANPHVAPTNPFFVHQNVVTVSGKIVDECGQGIEGIIVAANGSTVFTDATGAYSFENIPEGSDLQICVELEPDPLMPYSNQVTVCDIRTVSRHILGIEPLSNPVRMLCSDVNRSGSITTFDIVEMLNFYIFGNPGPGGVTPRQYLLLSNNPAIAAPLNNTPTCFTLTNLQQSVTDADFVRVAIGDADGSGADCNPVPPVPVKFLTADVDFLAGENFTVALTPEIPVSAFQFAIRAEGLVINSITDANPVNTLSSQINGDLAKLVWLAGSGALEQPVILIDLTASADGTLSDQLSFVSASLPTPAVSTGFCAPMFPQLQYGTSGTGDPAIAEHVIQNAPNPWLEQTQMEIFATSATEAHLSVMDITGKTLYVRDVQLAAGNNVIALQASDIQASGLLFFRVMSDDASWSGQMIKL